jgi:DNA ligase 1
MHFSIFAQQIQDVQAQKSYSDKVEALGRLFAQVEDEDLSAAIYLCQGMLHGRGTTQDPYRIRNSEHPIITRLRVADDHNNSMSPTRLIENLRAIHQFLNEHIADIDAWLLYKRRRPSWLDAFSSSLSRKNYALLVQLMKGRLYSDRDIAASLITQRSDSGTGALESVLDTYRRVADLGFIASSLRKTDLWTVITLPPQPGIPLKPNELTRFDSADEAWSRLGPCFVQKKLNGWQLQIHKVGQNVKLFSRGLEDITRWLPDVVAACRAIPANNIILDSEIVGVDADSGEVLDYERTLDADHHRVEIFDVMLVDGEDWCDRNYVERRKKLVSLVDAIQSANLVVAAEEYVTDKNRLQELYEQVMLEKDFEGLILQRATAKYLIGNENPLKGKLKPYQSIDAIVLGYEPTEKGQYRLLVGVWKDLKQDNTLVPVGKIDTGKVKEAVRNEVMKLCHRFTVRNRPYNITDPETVIIDHWIAQEIVVEVKIYGKEKNDRYLTAGGSLYGYQKFRLRRDKGPEDADDLKEYQKLPPPAGSSINGLSPMQSSLAELDNPELKARTERPNRDAEKYSQLPLFPNDIEPNRD